MSAPQTRLEVETESSEARQKIVDAARSMLGVPFVHQGRSPRGVDCVGLLVLVARQLGMRYRDNTTYGRCPNPRQLTDALSASCVQVAEVNAQHTPDDVWKLAQPGDVIAFWTARAGLPQHVAIRTERGILHTWANVRRVVEHGMTDHWRERVHSVWRYQPHS